MTSIDKTIFASAVLIILLPFLGFPRSWEETAISLLGLFIILILSWRSWRIHKAKMESSKDIDNKLNLANSVPEELDLPKEVATYNQSEEDLVGPPIGDEEKEITSELQKEEKDLPQTLL